MPEPAHQTRPLREDERDRLSAVLPERRGGELIAGRGRLRQLPELQALVAWDGEERVGVATYAVEDGRAELVTLDALREGAASAGGSSRPWRRRIALRVHAS